VTGGQIGVEWGRVPFFHTQLHIEVQASEAWGVVKAVSFNNHQPNVTNKQINQLTNNQQTQNEHHKQTKTG
jgi:hypothetical protein